MTTRTQDRLRIWTAAAMTALVILLLTIPGNPATADVNSDPDSTREGAVSLGDITGQHRAKGGNHSIDGVGDVVDYFSFSLTTTREVMVKLTEMERNANLFLEDQDGNELASSTETGTANEAIFQELDAGTYYIRVRAMQRGSNIYKLRYRAREIIPENVAATGAPTISGTAEVGHTLSADTSGISDDNGLTNAQFAYQWLRSDNAISGATGSTYTLTADDEGNTIKVKVSFTDDDGYSETLTSSATDTVEKPANVAATGQPTITGTAQVGDTLTADTSSISDDNGLDNVQFSYQWVRNDGNSDGEIAGATDVTYLLTTDDLVHTIKVRVDFTDDNGYAETVTSAATNTVNRPPNALPTGKPAITGTLEIGEVLSVDTSAISDANGLSNPAFTYQWIHSAGTTDTTITGATGSTYTIAESDDGKAFKVSVSYTDDHGYAHTVTSDASAPVVNFDFLHNDDCPEDTTTTCILVLGSSFDGNIHNPNSREYEEDWVKLEDLTTGRYRFRLRGHGSSPSPGLTMIIRKEGRSPGQVADGTYVHHFVAGSNAGLAGSPTDVYIEVRGENGDYRLSVERLSYIEPSGADLASGATTAGWLEVGYDPYPGKSGRVAYSSDGDAFWVDLEAGKNYRIDVRGNESADFGGTAPDPIMSLTMPEATSATLLNPIQDIVSHIAPGGVLSQAMIATGGGQGANARLDIAVNTSGQFLIEASDENSTGTYTVTVKELVYNPRGRRGTVPETSGGDLPDDGGTLGHVQVNGAGATGNIESTTDEDAFLVHLEAGRTYRVDVWGNDSTDDGGTLPDPTVDLLTAGDQNLAITDTAVIEQLNPTSSTSQQNFGIFDDDGGEGKNARLQVRVYRGGTYLVLAGSATLTDTGTYTVFVKDNGDTFTPAPRGSKQTVSEPGGQDLPNFLTSTGHVQVGGDGATGRIANANDQDVFAVKLHRGTQYRIEVWGDDPAQNGGTLADPKVTLRNHAFDRATNGGELEQIGLETWEQASRDGIHDNNSGSGKNARVDVAPHWSQRTYYIQVSGAGGTTGTYTVYVTEIGKANRLAPTPLVKGVPPVHSHIPTYSEPEGEDFPTDTTTKGWIKPDGSRAHGLVELDIRPRLLQSEAGERILYRIDMKGDNKAEPGGTTDQPAVTIQGPKRPEHIARHPRMCHTNTLRTSQTHG